MRVEPCRKQNEYYIGVQKVWRTVGWDGSRLWVGHWFAGRSDLAFRVKSVSDEKSLLAKTTIPGGPVEPANTQQFV